MSGQIKILIGYSSRLFCNGLEAIISGSDRFEVADTVPVWQGLHDRLEKMSGGEIVIIELCKPRKVDIEAILTILHDHPGYKIFLISHLAHHKITRELLECGIGAYLLKSCSQKDLLMALEKLSDNKNYFCSDITMSVMNSVRESKPETIISLTVREREILKGLVSGNTNNEIAGALGLSENTVKAHRRNIQAKFGVNNLLGMVRYACRSNLIDFGKDDYCIECPHCYQN